MINFIRRYHERQRAEIERVVRESVRAESDKFQADLSAMREANSRLTVSLAAVTQERDSHKAKIREQTEADLVVVSLKIITLAVKGEPRDAALESQQQLLQRQLAAMQNSAYASYGGG